MGVIELIIVSVFLILLGIVLIFFEAVVDEIWYNGKPSGFAKAIIQSAGSAALGFGVMIALNL